MKPVVVVLVGHYLPGSKAGGPIRSVANLVAALGDEFDFRVITQDRDLGDAAPFPDLPTDRWTDIGKASVRYLPPDEWNRAGLSASIRSAEPDLVYTQSYFSPLTSAWPRLLARRGALEAPLLVAPRGEFSPGALAQKSPKKRLFLALSRLLGLHRGVLWHATAEEEAAEIRRNIPGANVFVAPPFPTASSFEAAPPREKRSGELRAVFVGRISPKKGLDRAVRLVNALDEDATLDVYGPDEDVAYAELCRAADARGRVRWHGPAAPEEVPHLFAKAHVFLFPTLGENYGHAIMESLQSGTPVVLSEHTPWRGLKPLGIGADVPDDDDAYLVELRRMAAVDAKEFARISGLVFAESVDRAADPLLLATNRALLNQALSESDRSVNAR